jgi:hypothetical protein
VVALQIKQGRQIGMVDADRSGFGDLGLGVERDAQSRRLEHFQIIGSVADRQRLVKRQAQFAGEGVQAVAFGIAAQDRFGDGADAEFIDDPQAGLDSPKTTINTAAGGVFGALLGLMVIFALEWIESGIMRRPDDITRYLDIPVIGTIPDQQ